ncbi:MAG TPA: hypothetical protein ENN45_02010 [Bacteroidetes bacterium]|nr:hypothetical protein [Bacteroidota bacterium]
MKPLATRLINEAEEAYKSASEKFENSSIPDHFPNYYKTNINKQLESAEKSLKDSKKWYDQYTYYTSTSKSFQSLISSRFVNYTCDYYDSGNQDFINELLEQVEEVYNESSKLAKNTEIVDLISLQTVGAAQRRATEAKLYLDSAKSTNLYTFSDVLDFLYDIAFVVERCNSISWWIGIGDHFNSTGNITDSKLENIALEYIYEAQQAVTYSEVILNELSQTSYNSASYLSSAKSLLETARDDLDSGFPAAAFFEALEALVKANLALEVIGTNEKDKIDISSEQAINNIAKSRKQGIEPVLAVSYYEYAESLSNESSFESALIYYKYSGMIAGAISYTNASAGSYKSSYVGISRVNAPLSIWVLERLVFIIGIFVLGGLAGLGIGLIIGSFLENKQKKKKPPVHYSSRTYDHTPRYYYPNNQIPRSIKEYYKKNK